MRQENIFTGVEIIIKRGNKIALGKRKNAAGEGQYGLPGGHVEFGERLIDTAIRELEEETGLKVQPEQLSLVAVVDDPREENHYLHIAFLLENFEGEPECREPHKCEGWEWFDLDALPETFFGHLGVFETFKSGEIYLR